MGIGFRGESQQFWKVKVKGWSEIEGERLKAGLEI